MTACGAALTCYLRLNMFSLYPLSSSGSLLSLILQKPCARPARTSWRQTSLRLSAPRQMLPERQICRDLSNSHCAKATSIVDGSADSLHFQYQLKNRTDNKTGILKKKKYTETVELHFMQCFCFPCIIKKFTSGSVNSGRLFWATRTRTSNC